MYQKYQTDAVVLGSREFGEADKTYALYTRDFGLVRARASAVRRESSKMRYALQDCSLASVSLVRGKRGWRVAGARSEEPAPRAGIHALARAAELVARLIPGEERNEYLYQTLLGAHAALFLGENIESIEILAVARVLYALGYISAEELRTDLFASAAYTPEILLQVSREKTRLLGAINRALSETHL